MTPRAARVALLAPLLFVLSGCVSRVCGREFGLGYGGVPRRAANSTCRTWVHAGYVSWPELAAAIQERPWTVQWGVALPRSDSYFTRARVLKYAWGYTLQFRDPDKLGREDLREDVTHEVSHVVLFEAGVPAADHHGIMPVILKDPAHAR